jgi:hypothetical protein
MFISHKCFTPENENSLFPLFQRGLKSPFGKGDLGFHSEKLSVISCKLLAKMHLPFSTMLRCSMLIDR